jgi:hypothetical protein
MIYEIILAAILGLLIGGTLGYFLGRHQAALVDKIRTLEEQSRQEPKPEPEKPGVTMGSYQPPREISTSTDTKRAGLVEAKTPQRLEWEQEIAIEKEVLGR